MKWIDDLYVGEGAKKNKEKIIWKIKHNAGMINVYVIAFASNDKNLFDIINSAVLLQKGYPKKDLIIVGIAKGYDEAVEIVRIIIDETYKKTGGFDVRNYIKYRWV